MQHEPIIRLVFFVGVLVAMAVWEVLAPRRRLTVSKPLRWFSNLGLVVVNTIAVRLVFALGAVGVALVAQERGWGLFNNFELPDWLEVVLAVVALDLVIYLQHVMFHAVPLFWRLHMVHHADLDFDVTTGLRFHTIEILLSMGIKVGCDHFAGDAAGGRVDLRGAAERHVDVQPQQRADADLAGSRTAAGGRDARHAPRTPLDDRPRDQQQLRLQPAVVGLPDGHVSRAAFGGP